MSSFRVCAPSGARHRRSAQWLASGLLVAAAVQAACEGRATRTADEGPVLPGRPEVLDPELLQLVERHAARVRERPQDARRHGKLGLVYEANDLWPEARASFERARALATDEPAWHLHAAIVQHKLGDAQAALASLREGVRLHPGFAPLAGRLGDLCLQGGDFEGGRSAYEAAARLAPQAPEPLVGLGEIALADGEPELAIEYLERAIALDPDYRCARYVLGLAYRAAGRQEEAQRELALGASGRKRALRDPASKELGRLSSGVERVLAQSQRLLKQGRAGAAAKLLEPVAARHPDDARLRLNLGLSWFQMGRQEEGIAELEECQRLEPGFHMVPFNLAACLLSLGRPAEALGPAERAIELSPEFPPSHFVLGRALFELGRDEQALLVLDQAQRRDPKNPGVQGTLGELCLRLGRREDARAHFARACDLAPQDWTPRGGLVRVALEQGAFAQAEQALAEARRLAPEDAGVAALALELERARKP